MLLIDNNHCVVKYFSIAIAGHGVEAMDAREIDGRREIEHAGKIDGGY